MLEVRSQLRVVREEGAESAEAAAKLQQQLDHANDQVATLRSRNSVGARRVCACVAVAMCVCGCVWLCVAVAVAVWLCACGCVVPL